MVDQWEPGTQYDYGAVVIYEGHKYKIVQPHRSQGDWAPPLVPALWGRVPDDHGSGGDHDGQHQQHYNAPQQGYGDEKKHDQQQQQQQQEHHDDKKNWVGEHKKELEIGAGLLAGAAALAGGAFAYKKHKEHEREEEEGRRRDD